MPLRVKGLKILALDYGERRLGVALGIDGVVETLPEIEICRNDRGFKKKSIERIKEICQQEGVGLIILGISEGKTAKQTQKFAKSLKMIVKLPIRLVDETLTTWESRMIARKLGKTERFKKDHFDSIAAAILLKRFFEREGVNV